MGRALLFGNFMTDLQGMINWMCVSGCSNLSLSLMLKNQCMYLCVCLAKDSSSMWIFKWLHESFKPMRNCMTRALSSLSTNYFNPPQLCKFCNCLANLIDSRFVTLGESFMQISPNFRSSVGIENTSCNIWVNRI